MRYHAFAIVTALALAAPDLALAQAPGVHAEAEAVFLHARDAMKGGRWEEALGLFRKSQAMEAGRGKLINMAICEQKLGRPGSALRHFQEVLPQLPSDDDRLGIVKQHIATLTPLASFLRLDLAPGAPAGTAFRLDGELLSASVIGRDVPVDAGQHEVLASADMFMVVHQTVTLGAREHKAISMAPTEPIGAPQEPEGRARTSKALTWKLGVASLAVGGASLIAGIGTGAAAVAKRSSILKQCPEAGCSAALRAESDQYEALGAASTATFVLGGAFAGAGVVLLVISRRTEKPNVAGIEPLVGPGVLGLQGRF